MSRPLARVSFLALGFAFLAAVHAQDAAPPAPLSLEESISRAMKKNFDLQIQNYSTEVARESLNVAEASFSPVFTATGNRSLSQAATATTTLDGTNAGTNLNGGNVTVTTVGPRSDNTSASIGVSQLLPQTNGTVGLSAGISRGATNSRFSTLNPAFGDGVTATLTQPLLRNAGSTVAHAAVERNKLGLSIAQLIYESSVLTVVLNTETAYNNLVSARETLRIRQLSLDLAQKLFEENSARRTTGVMTDIDVLTAEVGVNNARLAVIQAEQGVRNAEDSLLALINTDDFNQRPGPVAFAEYTGETPAFDVSYKLARDNSPDYIAQVRAIQQSEIDLALAKSAKLPTLNLTGSLGYTATDKSYGSVINDLPDNHGNNWGLGIVFSVPWGQKADNARYRSTLATMGSQKARLAQLDQGLVVQVRTAVRSVQTNLVSVSIAAKATQLSVRQYEAQKARFDAGLSTSRLVLQAQDDLETARFNELSAKASLRNALAQLHRLETSSLQKFNIQLSP